MSVMSRMKSTDVSPKTALISILVFLLVAGGAIFGLVKLLTGSSGTTAAVEPDLRPAITAAAKAPAKNTAVPVTTDDAIIVKRNLFRLSGAPVGPIIPPNADMPPPPFGNVAPVTPPAFVPPPPQPKLAYTGIVEIAGKNYALIENLESKMAEYICVGSMAFGYKLLDVNAEFATIEVTGQPVTLNMGANKVEETTAKPAEPAPAAPAAQPAATPPAATATPEPAPGNRFPNREGRGRGRSPQEGQ
jgi:hypothetical protein